MKSISRHQTYRNLHQTYVFLILKYKGSQPTKKETPSSHMTSNFRTKLTSRPPTRKQIRVVAIVVTGRCKYWITDVDLMKHQWNETESPSDDPILPEVYTATVACIYNEDGKCKGMLTLERLTNLQRAFERAKYSGLHDNIHPPPMHRSSWVSSHAKIQLPPDMQVKGLTNRSHVSFPPTSSPPYKNGPSH